MFWIMAFFGWKIASQLQDIGQELEDMASELREDDASSDCDPASVSPATQGPPGDGVWVDYSEVFGVNWRRN